MTRKDHIDVVVRKTAGGEPLTLANFDIADLAMLLTRVEPLFYPGKKKDRPIISLKLDEGSVVARLTTLPQGVKTAEGILALVSEHRSLQGLERDTAQAILGLLDWVRKSTCEIRFRKKSGESLLVLDPATRLEVPEDKWYDVELYLRGTVVDAGGKHVSNLHLQTEDYGLVRIEVDPEYLAGLEENILYKQVVARVTGRKNLAEHKLDLQSLKLLELSILKHYDADSFKSYLNELREKAASHWEDVIDVDKWLQEIRYGDDC